MDKKQFGNQMKKWISSIIDKDVDFSIKNRYQLIEDLCYLMSKLEPHLINQNQNKKLTPKEKWNYFINSCLKYGVSQEYLISFHNFLKEGFESRVLLLIYQIGSISKQRQHSIERKKNKKQNLNETKISLKNSNSFENANFKNFQNKKILSNISLTHVKKNLNSNEWTTNSLQKQIFTKKAKEQKTNKKNDSKILQNKKQLENELEIGKKVVDIFKDGFGKFEANFMMKNEEKNIYYPHQQKPMWIKLSRENFSILEYCNETEVEVYQYLNKNQSLLCESTENPNVVRIDFKDGWVMELHFLSEKSKSVFAKAFSMFQRYLPSYTIGSPIYADILNRKQEIQALASSFVRNQNVKFQVKIQQQFSELFYSSILEIDLFKIRLISQAINHDLYFVGNVTQISKLQKQKKVLVIDVQNHDLITNPVHIFCESTTTRSLIYETLIKFWRKSRNNFLNSMELSKYEHFQSVRKQNNPHQDPILIASFNSKGEIDLIQPQLLIPEYTEINPSKYDQMYFCDSQNKKTSNDLLSQIEKKKTIGPINISIFKSEKQQFVPASFTFNLQNSTILVFDRSNFSFEFKYHKKHQLIIIQPTNKNIFLFRVDSEHALIIQTQNQKDLDCILLTYFHLRKISKFQEQENQNPNFGIPTTKAMTKRKNPKISSEFVFNFPQKSITLDNEYEDNTNQEDQEIEYQATISDVISTIHERVDIVLRSDHFSILSATFSISRYYSVHSVLIPLKKALTQNSKRDENVQFHFDEFDYILIEFPNSRVLQNFMNDFKHHKKKYLFETQKIFIPRKFHFDCVIFLPQAEKPKFNAKITLGFQYIYIEIKNDSDQECDLKDRIKFQYLNATKIEKSKGKSKQKMYNLYLTEDRYIKILDISNQNNSFEFNSILHDFREYFLEGKYKTNPKYHQAKIILNQKYLGNCRIKLTNSHQLYLLTKNLEMHRIFLNIECKTMTNINNPKELRIETQKNTLSLIFSKVNECKIFEEKIVMNKRPQSPRKITTDSHFQGILYIIDNESFCEGSIKIQNGISSQICISQDDGQEIYKEKISDINIFSSTANKRLVRIQNAFGKEVIFSFLTEIARSQFLDQIQKLKEKSTEKEIKQEKELEIEIEIESEKEKEKEIKQEKEMHEIQRKISTLNELERLLNTHLQDFSENLTNYEVKFLSTDSISAAVLILEEDHLLINKNEQIINADYKTTKIYYHPRNNEVLRILIEKPSKISFVVKFFTHDLRSIFVDKFKRYKEFIMDSDDLIVSSTQKFFVKIIDTQKRFRGNGTFTFENIDNSSRLFLDTRIGILELKNQAQLSLSNDQGKFIKIKSDQNDSNRLVFLFNDQKKQNDFAILFANHLKNYLKSSDFLTLKNQLEFSVKWIKLENFQNAFGLISIQFETMTLIATCEKSIFNFKLSNISKLIQSNKRKTVSYIIIDSKHSLKIQFENQNQREKFQQIFEHCLTLI